MFIYRQRDTAELNGIINEWMDEMELDIYST